MQIYTQIVMIYKVRYLFYSRSGIEKWVSVDFFASDEVNLLNQFGI
jgi:hypothetical protein